MDMRKRARRLSLGIVMVALAPRIAAAQEFDQAKIRPGQTVLVRDLTGSETEGVVQSVDPSRLVVQYRDGRFQDPNDPSRTRDSRAFTPAQVDRVRRPDPLWDGAVKGAVVALVPVFLHGECEGCSRVWDNVLFLAAGAGIGMSLDAVRGPKTVYRNRSGSRTMTLVPIIGRDHRGFSASIRF
jgi:hypothetical protein